MTIHLELPMPAVLRRASDRLLRRIHASPRLTRFLARLGVEVWEA